MSGSPTTTQQDDETEIGPLTVAPQHAPEFIGPPKPLLQVAAQTAVRAAMDFEPPVRDQRLDWI